MSKQIQLENRLRKLKAEAPPITFRTIKVEAENAKYPKKKKSEWDKRIVRGYLIKWNQRNFYGEKVIKGAVTKSINERGPNSNANYKMAFLWMHKQDDPLALFANLEEDDYGLYFETAPLDDVPSADRALKQLASGTLNQFSIGFDYVWDKIEYDDKDDSLVLKELNLFEGSVVTIGADQGTFATRSQMSQEDLHDEIEDFINILPRKDRLQARKLFALQKTLSAYQNETTSQLESGKPSAKGLNIKYLTKNL